MLVTIQRKSNGKFERFPQNIPEQFLPCDKAHYPAETGQRNQEIPFPLMGLHGLQQCISTVDIKILHISVKIPSFCYVK